MTTIQGDKTTLLNTTLNESQDSAVGLDYADLGNYEHFIGYYTLSSSGTPSEILQVQLEFSDDKVNWFTPRSIKSQAFWANQLFPDSVLSSEKKFAYVSEGIPARYARATADASGITGSEEFDVKVEIRGVKHT